MATPMISSASAVLGDEELLALICREFLPWDATLLSKKEVTVGRIQLLNVALVCKTFTDPALSCLWSHLTSLVPLIKLLPNVRVVDGEYYFHGAPSVDSSFYRHAQRVRVLEFGFRNRLSSTTVPKISSHIPTLLLTYLKGRPLFPGLRKVILEYDRADGAQVGFLYLVIVPSVEEVDFSGPWFPTPVFTDYCLSLVREHKSTIRRLSITHDGLIKTDALSRILEVTSHMTQLEALKIGVNTTEAVQSEALSQTFHRLTNLKEIEYEVSSTTHSRYQPYSSFAPKSTPELPQLSRVVLHNCSGNYICSCIPRFLLDKASAIWLSDYTQNATPDMFVDIVNGLAILPSLIEVNLSVCLIVEASTLLPIFTSLWLRRFTLIVGTLQCPYVDLADIIIRGARKHRPAVEHIELIDLTIIIVGTSRGATLEPLANIAAGLPGLETLTTTVGPIFESSTPHGLSIDEWLNRLRQSPPSGSKLRTLVIDGRVARSPLPFRDVDTLAQILDLLFPSLEVIRPLGDLKVPFWKDFWAPIEQQRRMYQKIRMLSAPKRVALRSF